MSNLNDDSMEEHIALTDNMTTRLDSIYKELCEYEEAVNQQTEDEPIKLFELLETVNEIYATAQRIHPTTQILKQQRGDLRDQMESLQHAIDLLKLEKRTKRVEVVPMD